MTFRRTSLFVLSSWLLCASSGIFAQSPRPFPGVLPKVLLLVYQQMQPGKAGERQRLEVDTSRRFDELNVPITWIELEAVTGPPQALFFDPASSFEELDRAGAMLANTFASHPELAQQQEQIELRLASSRTAVAIRRDELDFSVEKMDLTKARYLRITVMQLRPGREQDFVEAEKVRRTALNRAGADVAWAMYEANAGLEQPTFLLVEPLKSLQDVDKRVEIQRKAEQGWEQTERKRVDEITRDAYLSIESNLYVIHPEMSHVSREFAAGDPGYWIQK
jgi:hypothetical protein